MTTASEVAPPDVAARALPPHIGRGNRTILLIDDVHAVREALRNVIVAEGYQVRTAASVAAGLQHLGQSHVDLILTDLRMPKASGLNLLFHIHFQRPRLPIFVITALPLYACKGAEKVADAFFSKPIDLEQLLSAVHGQLDC